MPSIPADLNAYLSAALFVLGAWLMALYLGIIVWTFQDIRSRSRDTLARILAPLLVAVFNVAGLVVYLLVRPKQSLDEAYERALAEEAVLQDLEERRTCPGCQHRVEADFIICPYCQHQLRLRCVSCGRLIDPDWDVCPYCGYYHAPEETPPEMSAPALTPQPAEELAPELQAIVPEDELEQEPEQVLVEDIPDDQEPWRTEG